MKLFRKMMALCCVTLGVVALASCGEKVDPTFTYRTSTALGPKDFNPHTWETNTDSIVASYAEQGFVEPIYDIEKNDGSYTWAYEMATNIEDVTKNASENDREKWGISEEEESGRMYKISLNPAAKWANGEAINADSYVYSMKQLLNPKMKNYRANNYISGSSAIAGASDYYWSDSDIYVTLDKLPNYPTLPDKKLYLDVSALLAWQLDGLTPDALEGSGYDSYFTVGDEYLYNLYPGVFADCREELTLEKLTNFMEDFSKTSFAAIIGLDFPSAADAYAILTKTTALADEDFAALGDVYWIVSVNDHTPALEYDDTVGLYKLDDYTIMYVLSSYYSEFYFKMSMGENWLVYEPLYEAGKQTIENLTSTNYGTTVDKYMSYGPYKLATYEQDKQLIFERNENWYGYTDGKHENQYKTDRIVIDIVDQHETQLLGFLQGKYDDIDLNSVDMQKYGNSEWLKYVNTTYTWRLSFNTNLDVLKSLEGSSGNNKQVLANDNFRAAFSMCIDRQKFINEAVGAGSPAYFLINNLYMYDVENNPNSVYRNTAAAKKAVVDLYDIEYGDGKTYKNLDEAYAAVSGFDLPKARELMQKAYEECKANGTYTDGQKISLDLVVTSRSSISEAARKNATVLDAFLKEAIKGTGFEAGGIELNPKALSDYYNQMLNGACEMIFAAWGGAVYWPYHTIECYVNDAALRTQIHEGACWKPESTPLTLKLDFNEDGVVSDDEVLTMTYNQWGIELNEGRFAESSFDLRNDIMGALEHAVLSLYYTIPLYCDASVSLDSKRLKYITDEYNIMYGFGGLRFLDYSYNDAEWAKYVSKQGGTLSYE